MPTDKVLKYHLPQWGMEKPPLLARLLPFALTLFFLHQLQRTLPLFTQFPNPNIYKELDFPFWDKAKNGKSRGRSSSGNGVTKRQFCSRGKPSKGTSGKSIRVNVMNFGFGRLQLHLSKPLTICRVLAMLATLYIRNTPSKDAEVPNPNEKGLWSSTFAIFC